MEFEVFRKKIRDAGVIGAGGAGFPTYGKIFQNGEAVIMNAAECEPLFKTDQNLLKKYAYEILKGFNETVESCGMKKGIISIKNTYRDAVQALESYLSFFPKLEIREMDDIYPLGDEVVLIYETVGVVIPQGRLPKEFGFLVINVETCLNIYRAIFENSPVVTTHLTVSGMVPMPLNFEVNIGSKVEEILDAAGIPMEKNPEYEIIIGGPLTGEIGNRETVVSKTTKGILLLPKDRKVAAFKGGNFHNTKKQAKSSCSQCRNCTDLCPRYLLGHGIEPHKIMNAIIYGGNYSNVTGAHACCQCNLCTLYSCHQELDPLRVIKEIKTALRNEKIGNFTENRGVSREREYRRISGKLLKQKLGLSKYDRDAENYPEIFGGKFLNISLHQGIGGHSLSVVKEGDHVFKNQVIGVTPEERLGTDLHSPVDGVVVGISEKQILIRVME